MLGWCSLLFAGCLVGLAQGYGSGAPVEVCEDLTPQHGVPPQTTPFPYNINLSKNKIKAGENVDVTISGRNGLKFKGYIVQARVGSQPVGHFRGENVISCGGGSQNSATHSSATEKSQVRLVWQAPPNLKETVVFHVTVAKNGGEYWVDQLSRALTVQ